MSKHVEKAWHELQRYFFGLVVLGLILLIFFGICAVALPLLCRFTKHAEKYKRTKNSKISKLFYKLSEQAQRIDYTGYQNTSCEYLTCPVCLEQLNIKNYFNYQRLKQLYYEQGVINGGEFEYKKRKNIKIPRRSTVLQDADMCISECGHYCHFKCLRKSLKNKNKCVVCRKCIYLSKCKVIHMGYDEQAKNTFSMFCYKSEADVISREDISSGDPCTFTFYIIEIDAGTKSTRSRPISVTRETCIWNM